jgi:L-ascorbate metabolism protein UlaG (beta-lactamase superfamily)
MRTMTRGGALAVASTALVVCSSAVSAQQLTITPMIHASVQIEFGSQVIQVDPWSAGDLSRARPADLILITDDPIHHLDPAAIRQLRKPGAPVVVPPASLSKFPEGTPLANGESKVLAGISVEAIAAYDIKPGEPSHPKGKANGYVVTVGGRRIYFAGVTECVPEIRALKSIDIAFLPMNLPLDRMLPAATAECAGAFRPKTVYVNHYDQAYAARVTNPNTRAAGGGPEIAQSLRLLRDRLGALSIAFIDGDWYPARPAR